MRFGRVLISLIVGGALVLPQALLAQQTPRQKQRTPEPDYEVEELTPGQIRRAQEPRGSRPPVNPAATPAATGALPPTAAAKAPATAAATRAIACSGPFAKDSSSIKLATVFKSDNL